MGQWGNEAMKFDKLMHPRSADELGCALAAKLPAGATAVLFVVMAVAFQAVNGATARCG